MITDNGKLQIPVGDHLTLAEKQYLATVLTLALSRVGKVDPLPDETDRTPEEVEEHAIALTAYQLNQLRPFAKVPA